MVIWLLRSDCNIQTDKLPASLLLFRNNHQPDITLQSSHRVAPGLSNNKKLINEVIIVDWIVDMGMNM